MREGLENRDPINLKLLRRVLTLALFVCFFCYIGGPPILAYFYPWEPPVSDEGVDGSVLRVIVPEGEPYEIDFGSVDSSEERVGGTVPDGEYYVDHPVPPRAESSGQNDYLEINVMTGVFVVNSPDRSTGDVPVQGVLFVDSKYARCSAGHSMAIMNWSRSYDELMSEAEITFCNLTRWNRFFPGYPDFYGEE